ncbi:MAG: gliding motility-associated C-terminal domain-containing protein [Bacteroidota bacterium]
MKKHEMPEFAKPYPANIYRDIYRYLLKIKIYPSPFFKEPASDLFRGGLRGIFLHFLLPIIFYLTLTTTASAQNFKPDTLTLPINTEYVTSAELTNDSFLDYFFYGTDSVGNLGYWIYENQGDQTFVLKPLPLPTVTDATFAFADLNRDNQLDMIISGNDSTGIGITQVFFSLADSESQMLVDSLQANIVVCADFDNDGRRDLLLNGAKSDSLFAFVYQNMDTAFIIQDTLDIALQEGIATAYDWNEDDEIDLLLSGITEGGEALTQLYENQTEFVFEPEDALSNEIIGTALTSGDYNHDGDSDILISGHNFLDQPVTQLYQYTNQAYELVDLNVPPVEGQFASLADYNHDGLADIGLAGTDSTGQSVSRWYFNQDSTLIEEAYDSLLSVSKFHHIVGDMDNDGNLEALVVLNYANSADSLFLLWNQSETDNLGPDSPTNPRVCTIADETLLRWDASPDDTTALSALTFDLYVRLENDTSFKVSPEFADGFKHRADYGRSGYGTRHTAHDLPEGTFFWGVAGVDNSFQLGGRCEGPEVCFTILREDTSVCLNTTLQLAAEQTVDWYSTQQGFLQTSQQLDYTVERADTLYYSVQPRGSCAINYTITIATDDSYDPIPSDTVVCRNELLTLASDTVFLETQWFSISNGSLSASDTLTVAVSETDTIWLEATLPSGCLVYDTVAVNVFPDEDLIADTLVTIQAGSSVTLTASEATDYRWSPATNLSNTAAQSPTVSPPQTTTYFLEAVTLNGCLVTDSITVVVEPAPALRTFFVPNLFSPNGDGKNDQFRLYGQRIETLTFQVYDRQGTLLFETNRIEEGWDGKYRNQPLPNGLYVWKISGSFEDGTPLQFEGAQSGQLRLVR